MTTSPTTVTTTAARPTGTRATKATYPATRAATTGSSSTEAGTSPASTKVTVGGLEQQVFTLTNKKRIAAGCPALVWNDTLAAVARAHSADMAANNYFDHNNKTGLTPARRVLAAGYTYTLTAENIAAGQPTAQDVLTGWRGLPPERGHGV